MHHFQYRDGALFAEDVNVTELAGKVGTPFYVYSAATLRRHVRVMREIYPPRMTLNVRITGADGQVLSEGERKLSDMSYLQNSRPSDTDNLRFEKRMIDDWLRRELPAAPQA